MARKTKKSKPKINRKKTVSDGLKLKKTDRTKFCWNCLHANKKPYESPCDTCFGTTHNGTYFHYKNWEEGVDYVN